MVSYVDIIFLVSSFLVIHVASAVSSEFQEMLNLVNAERASKGAPAVCLNAKLNQVAQRYAQVLDAAGAMEHEGVDGTDLPTRLQAAGFPYSSAGEVLAKCSKPQDAVRGWINSPSHHSAMIDPKYQLAGIGQSGLKWVMYYAASGEEKCSSELPATSPSPSAKAYHSTDSPASDVDAHTQTQSLPLQSILSAPIAVGQPSSSNPPATPTSSPSGSPSPADSAASQEEIFLDLSSQSSLDTLKSIIIGIFPGLAESSEQLDQLNQALERHGIGKGGVTYMAG
ncbi:hypothetical protein MIR68_008795 [Amoeboaphelidium protococcarum]|nr:hypothetical protein MIR68_008795 [Amoeboaphelidium protococcarum]